MPVDPRQTARRRASSKGFTLTEVLIATSLAAMVSIMVLASLQTSFRYWGRAATDADAIERLTFVHGFLRRMIEGAYPRLRADGSGAVDFEGDATSLEFIGPSISALAIPGRTRVMLKVIKSEDGERLIVNLAGDPESERTSTEETLLEGPHQIRFSYQARDSADWISDWRGMPGLPALVRLDVQFEGTSSGDWPPLIVRPLIDADVDCRFDPLTGGCRGRRS